MTWWLTQRSSSGTSSSAKIPATIRTCTKAFQVTDPGLVPPLYAANQYGTSATSPSTADPSATLSHHPWRAKSAQVATQNAAIVSRHSVRVTPHSTPDVDPRRPAKAGVSHNQVLPARTSEIPPRLRM